MRIVLASMAPFLGGAEVAVERLAMGLQDAGHEVLVVLGTRGPVLERLERAGLHCLHSPMYLTDKWRWVRYARARDGLRRILKRHRPDVIHSNDLPTHQMVSDASRGLGIPRFCHHRFPFGGQAIDWLNKFGAERHLFVSRALMGEMCRDSERLARSPRAVVHDGLPIPSEPNTEERRQARARLGLPDDQVIALFAGQVSEHKGVGDLMRAWSMLEATSRQRAMLVVVGDDLQGRGSYRAAMQELAGDLGCPARFVGFQHDVGSWMVASDLVVMPSRVEPLGLVTMEAMSHARPVIGTDVGGIPEMIVHEETGLLVPPCAPDRIASALGRLLADEPARRRLGRQGRRRCEEHFSIRAHVEAILGEYKQVLTVLRIALPV